VVPRTLPGDYFWGNTAGGRWKVLRKLFQANCRKGASSRASIHFPSGEASRPPWKLVGKFAFWEPQRWHQQLVHPLFLTRIRVFRIFIAKEAEHWFHGAYPGRGSIRVSALREPIADQKATPKGTFALRLTDATRFAGAVREMLTELVASPCEQAALRERSEELLTQAKLKPDDIKSSFLKPFA
jgi:hypothetical protein